ncbi:MAG TPA: phosphate ABC transporter substrate-binding protein PstS [Gemmatimonadales bacterium]|nr:phosphate ABC transporter substrate-binding protein PstS [Gemmatimonadales bacterium]
MRLSIAGLPLLLALTAAAIIGCGSNEGSRAVTLTGAGATFPNPIYSRWFEAFAAQTGTRINYQAIGSGGGIRQYTEGTVDFGATDGPMSDEQIAAVGGKVRHFPTVLGAVVVTYNLPELGPADALRLDGPAIAAIYRGTVSRWNDPAIARLNPRVALPDKPIIVVHRSDGSGTTYIFTDYLAKISPEWKTGPGTATSVAWPVGLGGKGNDGVTQQVKSTDGAIGYVELIYALSNSLPFAQLRNAAGNWITPSLRSVTAAAAAATFAPGTDFRVSITNAPGAAAYPISSFTWLLIRPSMADSGKREQLRHFLQWMITPEAQQMARELKYAPLPPEVIALETPRIDSL